MTTTATTRRRKRPKPSRKVETALLAELGDGACLAGMDEVGRGALAGPVSVGVAVVDAGTSRRMPRGLADSKLLAPQAREDLVGPVRSWCVAGAVGHAEPAEIDDIGIMAALRLAGQRALAELASQGIEPGLVLLDGNHDWLAAPMQGDLFSPEPPVVRVPGTTEQVRIPSVRTQIKADATCAVVAAASVLAKVARDSLMVELDPEHPQFGWCGNKGYASPDHMAALREHGPCLLHRRSWRLPEQGGDPYAVEALDEADGDATYEAYGEAYGETDDAIGDELPDEQAEQRDEPLALLDRA
ncbi:ribonuclease HII [Georgenia halophila]|uniref:Ribonuclease n=1 Tax=Georgenia halophila TaxID=620889 RepID=A0ABP8L849_9MICO